MFLLLLPAFLPNDSSQKKCRICVQNINVFRSVIFCSIYLILFVEAKTASSYSAIYQFSLTKAKNKILFASVFFFLKIIKNIWLKKKIKRKQLTNWERWILLTKKKPKKNNTTILQRIKCEKKKAKFVFVELFSFLFWQLFWSH